MLLQLAQTVSYNSMVLKIPQLLLLARRIMEYLILLKELIVSNQLLKTPMGLTVICIQILRINFQPLINVLMLLTIYSNLELIKTRVSFQLLQMVNFSMLTLIQILLNRLSHLLMKLQLKMIILFQETQLLWDGNGMIITGSHLINKKTLLCNGIPNQVLLLSIKSLLYFTLLMLNSLD